MKERINQIIRAKNLTAAEFASKLGIQPSSVSHLLAGRNNPSLEFVKKLKETFPEYNLDWIVFGKGPVTISEPFKETAPVDRPVLPLELPLSPAPEQPEPVEKTLFDVEETHDPKPVEKVENTHCSAVKYMILVHQDNTFEVLYPSSL